MNNPIKSLIEARVSTRHYDSRRDLTDETITELVQLATRAPSAYNFQNWKFIAVRSSAAKSRLQQLAYGQQQVADAPVTFIVCGTLNGHEDLSSTLQPAVEAGALSRSVVESWIAAARESHGVNPRLQRDEAFRSASLAAMTLMLAAEGMGLATGAMSGFDAEALSRDFGLSPTEVPVMLITAGYAAKGNGCQKPRRELTEVMEVA